MPIIKPTLSIIALIITTSLAARGDDDSSPFELRGPTGKISNTVSLFSQRVRGLQTFQERFDLELEESLTNNTYTARVSPWVWWRLPEAIGGGPRNNKVDFELKEGWVERSSELWDLRVGNQIVTWGAADQINPTDIWNPRDLYDPLQSYKLPLFMAKLKIHPPEFESLSLEAIVSPFFRESRLPIVLPTQPTEISLTDSRWLLPVPSTLSAGGLNAPLTYAVTQPNYPKTWQAGARLNVLRMGGWDFSGSYYNGVETTPRMAITRRGSANTPNLPITITLNPSFHRTEMYGVDGAGSVSLAGHDVGTRFELAYFNRDNSRAESAAPEFRNDLVKDDYMHAVFGVDYTFPKKLLGTVLYANIMYVRYQRIEGQEKQTGQTVLEGLPNAVPWDSNFVVYLEDRIGSTLKITANAVYSAAHGDAYLSPGLQYSWTDNFKTSLGGDIFVGPQTGFFGQFHDNRRVNFTGSYVF